jgi:hypothetical protein
MIDREQWRELKKRLEEQRLKKPKADLAENQDWCRYTRALLLAAGGVRELAVRLGRSRQALYRWRRAPEELVPTLVELTDGAITRYHWRPDLYGTADAAHCEGRPLPPLPPMFRRRRKEDRDEANESRGEQS